MDRSASRAMSPVSHPSPTVLAHFIGFEIDHKSITLSCPLAFYSPVNPVGKVDLDTSVISVRVQVLYMSVSLQPVCAV